jgi:hypothetical protein
MMRTHTTMTVGLALLAVGQLNAKASSDGEDVLTPLILKAADTILTEVTKK